MVWYFVFMGLALLQWFILYPNGKVSMRVEVASRHNRNFIILLCIELIFFAGLRDTDIGADTSLYLRALDYYASLPKDNILSAKLVYPFDFEPGYFLFTKLCALAGMSEMQFLLLIAVIIYVPFCRFLYRYSENPMMSFIYWFAFGLFGYSLGLFRQMIAISITLYGFSYIKERKLVRYLLITILASTFHLSALIVIPLYFIYIFDVKRIFKWVLILETIVYVGARTVLLFILRFFPRYAGYIGGQYDLQEQGNTMFVFLNILLILGYYIYCKNEKNQNPTMHICINAMMVAVVIQAMAHVMAILGRITNYYSIYMVLLIPMCINRYFKQRSKLYANIIVSLFLILIFYIMNVRGGALEPYQFNWG